MKYLMVVDDDFIENFRTDYDGTERVIVFVDKSYSTRAVKLKPIIRPTVTFDSGESLYLSQGHIDAFLEYEKKESVKEVIDSLNARIGSVQTGSVYRNENCDRKRHCYDYIGWHCAGCNGSKENKE